MANSKKSPKKQLEKFSTLFTQLGLVLVLFVVYLTLEHKTEQKQLTIIDYEAPQRVFLAQDQEIIFQKEVEKVPKKEISEKTVFIEDAPIDKVDNETPETKIIKSSEKKPVKLDLNTVVVVDEPGPEFIETVPFIQLENAPVFKGCEGLEKEENKLCFDKKMKQFVQRNFKAELANELGLHSGKHKILTQFIIDDNGNVVDVKIRAPHKTLKNETQLLIEKLPKFTPGKQGRKNVKVSYFLPITFLVD